MREFYKNLLREFKHYDDDFSESLFESSDVDSASSSQSRGWPKGDPSRIGLQTGNLIPVMPSDYRRGNKKAPVPKGLFIDGKPPSFENSRQKESVSPFGGQKHGVDVVKQSIGKENQPPCSTTTKQQEGIVERNQASSSPTVAKEKSLLSQAPISSGSKQAEGSSGLQESSQSTNQPLTSKPLPYLSSETKQHVRPLKPTSTYEVSPLSANGQNFGPRYQTYLNRKRFFGDMSGIPSDTGVSSYPSSIHESGIFTPAHQGSNEGMRKGTRGMRFSTGLGQTEVSPRTDQSGHGLVGRT